MLSLASVSWYLAVLFAAWTLVLSLISPHPDFRATWNLLTAGSAAASVLFAILGAVCKRFLCSSRYYRRGWPLTLYAALAALLTGVFVLGFLG